MNDSDIIKAIETEVVIVELAGAKYTVKPLTVRRITKLAALLKSLECDSARFKDPTNPDFYSAMSDALVAAGDKMPEAICLMTGEDALKDQDIPLLALPALIKAVAKVNKPQELLSGFRAAMEVMKPERK